MGLISREKCWFFPYEVLHPKFLMLEVRLGMKNADGKKYDENCEKFELGSFSYRGPNSSETMTISVRYHL